MAKVCILGGGSWGIGLSVVLHKNGHEVTVWSAVPAEIQMLQENHEHKMLPGVKLPEDMIFTTDDPWMVFDLDRIRRAGKRPAAGPDHLSVTMQMCGMPATMAKKMKGLCWKAECRESC